MSTRRSPRTTPSPVAGSTSDAALALKITFLLGRHATFGHEPPTIARSTTIVGSPDLASVHARSFPPSPLPITRLRYFSAAIGFPFRVNRRVTVPSKCAERYRAAVARVLGSHPPPTAL